jgi:drug/metabolite transporter (DMT)-like permease
LAESAGTVAINFSAPLWSALISVAWLKERAGPVRWMVLPVGFLGVPIVTNPARIRCRWARRLRSATR